MVPPAFIPERDLVCGDNGPAGLYRRNSPQATDLAIGEAEAIPSARCLAPSGSSLGACGTAFFARVVVRIIQERKAESRSESRSKQHRDIPSCESKSLGDRRDRVMVNRLSARREARLCFATGGLPADPGGDAGGGRCFDPDSKDVVYEKVRGSVGEWGIYKLREYEV